MSIKPESKFKTKLTFITSLLPIMILSFSYSSTANAALSAITANTIQGTNPYLELNGVKAVDLSSLLSIKIGSDTYISDSSGNMKKDNGDGTYTAVTMITLPNAGDTFASVKTLAPADTTLYALNNTSIIPLVAHKDDDGDSTFTVTGNLKGEWTDKNGNSIGSTLTRIVNSCLAPYTLILSTTNNPEISTQYGDPRKTTYGDDSAKFIITPATQPYICHVTPGSMAGQSNPVGPADMWDTTKGFKVQSSYAANFPTTGSNGLYFTLDVGGVDATTLIWGDAIAPGVTGKVIENGITATMDNITATKVKVTLSGPVASSTQWGLGNPGTIAKPPTTQIVLEGQNSGGAVVVSYGFVINQWFINRGNAQAPATGTISHTTWCTGSGYLMPRVADLTNASGTAGGNGGTIPTAVPPRPASGGNYYQRRIGGGLFSEWGDMGSYTGSDWASIHYWTSDPTSYWLFNVNSDYGIVYSISASYNLYGACRSQ